MVKEVSGAGPEHLSFEKTPRTDKSKRSPLPPKGKRSVETTAGGELRSLIERVKAAETYRKERVHQVLEKLQRGELITSEAVREAARRILEEGV